MIYVDWSPVLRLTDVYLRGKKTKFVFFCYSSTHLLWAESHFIYSLIINISHRVVLPTVCFALLWSYSNCQVYAIWYHPFGLHRAWVMSVHYVYQHRVKLYVCVYHFCSLRYNVFTLTPTSRRSTIEVTRVSMPTYPLNMLTCSVQPGHANVKHCRGRLEDSAGIITQIGKHVFNPTRCHCTDTTERRLFVFM